MDRGRSEERGPQAGGDRRRQLHLTADAGVPGIAAEGVVEGEREMLLNETKKYRALYKKKIRGSGVGYFRVSI